MLEQSCWNRHGGGTKESNFHRICFEHQCGHPFIVLEHQYSCYDVMRKCSIVQQCSKLKDYINFLFNLFQPLFFSAGKNLLLRIGNGEDADFAVFLVVLLLFLFAVINWVYTANKEIYRGYYVVAQRYEFYFRVTKQYFTNERRK